MMTDKEKVKKFLEDEIKGVPQLDPIWFESLEYASSHFTMDIEDVLIEFIKWSRNNNK